MIRCLSLQSGSNGNCIYIEAGDVRLLFDGGISGKQAEKRLDDHGIDIREVDALILSHDHRDHAGSAGIYQRKFGLPIWTTPATERASRLGQVSDVRHFEAGAALDFGKVRIHTLPTPHDGVDGVCFVVEAADRRLGILTDLGHGFRGLTKLLPTLDAALIESNYDDEMLTFGPYPERLKERIRGPHGHLSNTLSARLIARHGRRLQWLALGHLSEENNRPDLARDAHESAHGGLCPIHMASRYTTRGPWEL